MTWAALRNGIDAEAANAEDAAWVVAAQANRQAFGPLYERYVDAVYRYCYHRLGDRETAEDATSLIFTKALGALARYRPEGGSFRSWLFVIAHNAVADDFRRTRPAAPLAEADLPDRFPGPEEIRHASRPNAHERDSSCARNDTLSKCHSKRRIATPDGCVAILPRLALVTQLPRGSPRGYPIWVVCSGRTTTTTRTSPGGLPP